MVDSNPTPSRVHAFDDKDELEYGEAPFLLEELRHVYFVQKLAFDNKMRSATQPTNYLMAYRSKIQNVPRLRGPAGRILQEFYGRDFLTATSTVTRVLAVNSTLSLFGGVATCLRPQPWF